MKSEEKLEGRELLSLLTHAMAIQSTELRSGEITVN